MHDRGAGNTPTSSPRHIFSLSLVISLYSLFPTLIPGLRFVRAIIPAIPLPGSLTWRDVLAATMLSPPDPTRLSVTIRAFRPSSTHSAFTAHPFPCCSCIPSRIPALFLPVTWRSFLSITRGRSEHRAGVSRTSSVVALSSFISLVGCRTSQLSAPRPQFFPHFLGPGFWRPTPIPIVLLTTSAHVFTLFLLWPFITVRDGLPTMCCRPFFRVDFFFSHFLFRPCC